MERLRLADSIPVILEARYLVPHFCPNLTAELLTGSFYELLTHHYHLEVIGAEEVIRAVILSDEEAQQLAVISGSAALCVESVGYLKGGIPLGKSAPSIAVIRMSFGIIWVPSKGRTPLWEHSVWR